MQRLLVKRRRAARRKLRETAAVLRARLVAAKRRIAVRCRRCRIRVAVVVVGWRRCCRTVVHRRRRLHRGRRRVVTVLDVRAARAAGAVFATAARRRFALNAEADHLLARRWRLRTFRVYRWRIFHDRRVANISRILHSRRRLITADFFVDDGPSLIGVDAQLLRAAAVETLLLVTIIDAQTTDFR